MPASDAITYPHLPKSTSTLRPGQYWGIRLAGGNWACGRVLQVPTIPRRGSGRLFLAGLMDWSSDEPPDDASIAGAALYAQAQMHIKTIVESGSALLRHRP